MQEHWSFLRSGAECPVLAVCPRLAVMAAGTAAWMKLVAPWGSTPDVALPAPPQLPHLRPTGALFPWGVPEGLGPCARPGPSAPQHPSAPGQAAAPGRAGTQPLVPAPSIHATLCTSGTGRAAPERVCARVRVCVCTGQGMCACVRVCMCTAGCAQVRGCVNTCEGGCACARVCVQVRGCVHGRGGVCTRVPGCVLVSGHVHARRGVHTGVCTQGCACRHKDVPVLGTVHASGGCPVPRLRTLHLGSHPAPGTGSSGSPSSDTHGGGTQGCPPLCAPAQCSRWGAGWWDTPHRARVTRLGGRRWLSPLIRLRPSTMRCP